MSTATKQIINNLIDEIPEEQKTEIIQFLFFVKKRNENKEFKDLLLASETSMDFWDNSIDDEVWNNA